MSTYEQLLELLELMERQTKSTNLSEERLQLAQVAISIIERTKATINTVLCGLEADVKSGKITKQEDIKQIEEFRQKFNLLLEHE